MNEEIEAMGFFDWLFGSKTCCEGDERLQSAIERVIEGTDPRIKSISNVRERLAPAVAHALDYAHQLVKAMPPAIEMAPEIWGQNPLLRAVFVRPSDVTNTLSASRDLRDYLGTSEALGVETVLCVVAATCAERTVFGIALDGDLLRQDIAQKTVGFNDFRLVGFAQTEAQLRARFEDIVLEALVLAALRDIADDKYRNEQLASYRQLLLTRLRLMEQSGAGLDALLDSEPQEGRDIDRLRRELAENEAELGALKSSGSVFESILQRLIEALHNAEAVIQPQRRALRLNSMNIIVGTDDADASDIELVEFSTVNPGRPRRVAFLASFPRQSVVEQQVDFDALMRTV